MCKKKRLQLDLARDRQTLSDAKGMVLLDSIDSDKDRGVYLA